VRCARAEADKKSLNKGNKLAKILITFLFYLLLQGTAYAAQSVLLRWTDNSENATGFFVERTVSDDCVDGWEVIAYTGKNQSILIDIHISGACYRVAAYNDTSVSPYSNIARVPPLKAEEQGPKELP
jgi:hypothetical protein